MKIFYRFIDRLVFAAGVLLFLQLPNFMDQYTQRLGGFYDSEKQHMERYREIAERHFEGDMQKLLDAFEKSNVEAMEETGKELERTAGRLEELKEGVEIMENASFLRQIGYLVIHIDFDIARGTLKSYTPGMPLTREGLISGLIGGVLLSLLFNGLVAAGRIPFRKKQKKLTTQHSGE
ncbi:MAG: DUF2937 family protein [Bacteroidales bacterium]|nr:DUF2937 family protein [Bacteroidales bacterium]MCF8333131.1 DUF2937 family protein [Bacteroidales bacterium]